MYIRTLAPALVLQKEIGMVSVATKMVDKVSLVANV